MCLVKRTAKFGTVAVIGIDWVHQLIGNKTLHKASTKLCTVRLNYVEKPLV